MSTGSEYFSFFSEYFSKTDISSTDMTLNIINKYKSIVTKVTIDISSLEKTLALGKTEGRRKRVLRRMKCLDSITDYKDVSLSKLQETEKDREGWHHWVTESQT